MEPTPDGWIPQWLQLAGTFVFGLVIIGASLIKYFRYSKAADAPAGSPAIDHLRLIGAALNDHRAVQDLAEAAGSIAQSAKEIRAIADRGVERDIERFDRVIKALERIAGAMERR